MNDVLDFHKNRLEKLKDELLHLYTDKDNDDGMYPHKYDKSIRDKENAIKECQEKITEIEKNLNKKDEKVTLFIIAVSKEKIMTKLDKKIFKKVQSRYGNSPKHWIPFKNAPEIDLFLNNFKRERGFNFDVHYGSENESDSDIIMIENNLDRIIGIIDLLSLCTEVIKTAMRFDRKAMGYVLLPHCRFLPEDAIEYMENKRKKVFAFGEAQYKEMPTLSNTFYEHDITIPDGFSNRLDRILQDKFKFFRNKINKVSDSQQEVRNHNNLLR